MKGRRREKECPRDRVGRLPSYTNKKETKGEREREREGEETELNRRGQRAMREERNVWRECPLKTLTAP